MLNRLTNRRVPHRTEFQQRAKLAALELCVEPSPEQIDGARGLPVLQHTLFARDEPLSQRRDHRGEQPAPIRKVVVQQCLADIGLGGDHGHACPLNTLADDAPDASVNDAPLRFMRRWARRVRCHGTRSSLGRSKTTVSR